MARIAAEPSEADYDSFCATVMASARGRWFLAEYARRHRKADTAAVLDALRRIETGVRASPPSPAVERLRDELRAIAAVIVEARDDLSRSGSTLTTAAKVMALLELLETRIARLIDPQPGDDEIAQPPPAERRPEAARAYLTVVPPPKLFEPSRMRIEPPPLEYTTAAARRPRFAPLPEPVQPQVPAATAMPEPEPAPVVALVQHAPPEPPELAINPDELYVPFQLEPLPQELPEPPRAIARPNIFADVMALSEAERIALFS